jgi:hypothetical protein
MTVELGLTSTRSRPEGSRGDLFAGGRSDALGVLRLEWGHAYVIDIDSTGRWLALRKDGLPAPAGRGPGQLRAAIIKDYAARPVTAR